ncbi:MAG: LysR substrate-binding domain-containing protein [Aliidongia sp.]
MSPKSWAVSARAAPKVEIRVVSGGSLPLIEGVRTGALDLAFTQFAGALPRGVMGWMLACEPLVAVSAPDHPLAGRRDVTLGALLDEVFVDLHPDWGTRQLVDRSFAEQRLSRRTSFEVDDLATQLDLVAHGLGIALVPRGVIARHPEDRTAQRLGVAELADPEICWELTAVFATDRDGQPASTATRMFLGLLRDVTSVLEEIAPTDD